MSAANILKGHKDHEETLFAIENAIRLAGSDKNAQQAIKSLGEGWIAEEALAIALYCALRNSDIKKALIMSINHDGDSDSTGAICGNILGAAYGISALPKEWIENVELKDLIINIANKLYDLSEHAFN